MKRNLRAALLVLVLLPFGAGAARGDALIYYDPDAGSCISVGLEFDRYAVRFDPGDFGINTRYAVTKVVARAPGIAAGARVPLLISDARVPDYPDSALYRQDVLFTGADWDTFALAEPIGMDGPIWAQFIYTTLFLPFSASEPGDSVPGDRNWVSGGPWGWGPGICNLAIGLIVETPAGLEEGAGPVPPRAFTLGQNHPNPFNPLTAIAFELDAPASVTLAVHDARGRLVETLLDGPVGAGRHEVVWHAAGRPTGIYLYELRVGDRIQRRKMVLLK